MVNKNYIYDKQGANVSEVKITSHHCWRCGKLFNITNPDDIKTGHHAIPEEMLPIRNVEVPVCRKCHDEINNAQSMQPHDKNRIKKKLEGLEKQYESLKLNFDSLKKELEAPEPCNSNPVNT